MNSAPIAVPALDVLHNDLCSITEQLGESLNRCETILNRIGVFRSPEPCETTGQKVRGDSLLENLNVQVDRLNSMVHASNDIVARLSALG